LRKEEQVVDEGNPDSDGNKEIAHKTSCIRNFNLHPKIRQHCEREKKGKGKGLFV